MIYQKTLTTAANTLRTDPDKQLLRVSKGLVYRIEVLFAPGCSGLSGCMICDGSYQVWPTSIGEWFTGDNVLISFEDCYLKESPPYEFVLYAHNEDDTYSDWIQVRLGLVTKEVFKARFMPSLIWEKYLELLSNISAQQEAQRQELLSEPFPWLVTSTS